MANGLALVCAVALILAAGCFGRPQTLPGDAAAATAAAAAPKPDAPAGTAVEQRKDAAPAPTNSRSSRLQKPPTQVLNAGFDEIVVESNLQVHNRAGSKNKSKIMLPSASNSTAAASQTNKSARSLMLV